MNMQKTGEFIQTARKHLNLSQRALGEYLMVTDKAVSKWERGLACPDVENLKNMALLFNCSITDIINGAVQTLNAQCFTQSEEAREQAGEETGTDALLHEDVTVTLDYSSTQSISPLLFGDNLEHTRGCINGGLSAQILKNRKFIGKPGRYGCANGWYPIGAKAAFSFGAPYTRHAEGYKMRRSHECNSQYITNYTGENCGFGQKDLFLRGGCDYEFTIAVKAFTETELSVSLIGSSRTVYDTKTLTAKTEDFTEETLTLHVPEDDYEARIEITFNTVGTVMIGAVSLLPCDNFRGMRTDVIARMKELGIRLLRWPGGNFAGEYNWKDGLLPRNMRAPLQAYLGLETQPHTMGYDFHEINTDDFVALCREIGAEPFITLNPTWNTPEESAEWVEYCNGDETTPYGKLRAKNGHREPYNVQFWSLGNEAGYGHMEGANTADAYANAVREHAVRMLEVSPGLTLCSSGPYPNQEWVDYSAKALSDVASSVSLHHYTGYPQFIDPNVRELEYTNFVLAADRENLHCMQTLRSQLGDSPVRISYDEWNAWYAWYRNGSVTEGIFAAAFLNMLYRNADKYGVMMACHFESVNEGAIQVHPDRAQLSPTGQAFTAMKHHANGMLCALRQDVTSTSKDSEATTTLLNRSYNHEKKFTLNNCGELISAVLYSSDDVVPGTVFDVTELDTVCENGTITVTLPPHSIAVIKTKLP